MVEKLSSVLNMRLNVVTSDFTVRRRAFTLIELLVVIAIIAILAAVLLPVLHQAQLRGEAASCIDHQRQLATAWIMYANDNNDGCAGNCWSISAGGEGGWSSYRGKFTPTGPLTQPTNWVSGWLDPTGINGNGNDPINPDSDNTNDDLLVDPHYASLGDYVKNRQIFICPSCILKVPSVANTSQRPFTPVRSVSMNCWAGYICNQNGQTGNKVFAKTTQITAGIGPVDLFVFMEERGESIDDASFLTEMPNSSAPTTIANFPTGYHNNAATVGFADGHVEVHRWFGEPISGHSDWSCIAPQNPDPTTKWNFGQVNGTKYLTDLRWMQSHASCPSN